ncbi:uncharacterized protein MONBRDRAFT_30726 [Monosiga brevicollis MX1]|uniref:Uncharacterized protein n=1 Tax=Monosiga brevicollis TaxID=81824 RepID=A9UNU1_MONBE|nr:uncharacterized protein MONBRDRAFT_30726 [Monosiga brevicollis MX1]EDQ92302.1 predicted protein [Monosiga brevicollis MX1]|eukprot:XP_001742064.1 hypothetical protein [Monosiga brevicollis MX1]
MAPRRRTMTPVRVDRRSSMPILRRPASRPSRNTSTAVAASALLRNAASASTLPLRRQQAVSHPTRAHSRLHSASSSVSSVDLARSLRQRAASAGAAEAPDASCATTDKPTAEQTQELRRAQLRAHLWTRLQTLLKPTHASTSASTILPVHEMTMGDNTQLLHQQLERQLAQQRAQQLLQTLAAYQTRRQQQQQQQQQQQINNNNDNNNMPWHQPLPRSCNANTMQASPITVQPRVLEEDAMPTRRASVQAAEVDDNSNIQIVPASPSRLTAAHNLAMNEANNNLPPAGPRPRAAAVFIFDC